MCCTCYVKKNLESSENYFDMIVEEHLAKQTYFCLVLVNVLIYDRQVLALKRLSLLPDIYYKNNNQNSEEYFKVNSCNISIKEIHIRTVSMTKKNG